MIHHSSLIKFILILLYSSIYALWTHSLLYYQWYLWVYFISQEIHYQVIQHHFFQMKIAYFNCLLLKYDTFHKLFQLLTLLKIYLWCLQVLSYLRCCHHPIIQKNSFQRKIFPNLSKLNYVLTPYWSLKPFSWGNYL